MGVLLARDDHDLTHGREVKGAAMRARLRAATEASIAEVGVAATSATVVAQRCGVSRGAMLHHYPTRDGLLIDTATHCWRRQREIMARLAEGLSAGRMDVEGFVRRLYGEVFQADAPVVMLAPMVSGRSEARGGEAVDGILADLFQSYRDLGQRAFAIAGLPPERIGTLITLIVSTLRGLRIQGNIDQDQARVDAVLTTLAEAVDGLLAHQAIPPRAGRPHQRKSSLLSHEEE